MLAWQAGLILWAGICMRERLSGELHCQRITWEAGTQPSSAQTTHTHKYRERKTHARTHKHRNTHTYKHTHTHTHAHAQTHTHTCPHAHTLNEYHFDEHPCWEALKYHQKLPLYLVRNTSLLWLYSMGIINKYHHLIIIITVAVV